MQSFSGVEQQLDDDIPTRTKHRTHAPFATGNLFIKVYDVCRSVFEKLSIESK